MLNKILPWIVSGIVLAVWITMIWLGWRRRRIGSRTFDKTDATRD